MNKKQAKQLFDKYLKNECSVQEIEMLDKYLQSYQDKERLWSELRYDEEIKDQLWMKIKSDIDSKGEENRFSIKQYLKYAAVFIGLVGSFLWYQSYTKEEIPSTNAVSDAEVILKTSNNAVKNISSDAEQDLFDKEGKVIGKQKGNQLIYNDNEQLQELVFNELIVPDGKKFEITLSDGTLVHMNSRSTLKYPVNFITGEERQVFLQGEAYFEVAKDSLTRFLVTTDEIEIEVLGTHFSVSSYDGAKPYALLAEGSVAVHHQKNDLRKPTIILPGEIATLDQNAISVDKVNIHDYLSWREGRLTFTNESFVNIVSKIERHFGVSIENNYTDINEVKFRGEFKQEETITDILNTFQESAGFEYKIVDNKIMIDPMEDK
ncbi:FecR domain-containing protein [Aurantibacter sp.]|uniref:FecR family protein n=1 Tax=Aurantibacter sp. TaxID=2807103 RepID=UPI0032641EFE